MDESPFIDVCCACCHVAAADASKSLRKYGGCRKVSYCSKDCQRRHWREHKAQCQPQYGQSNADATPQPASTSVPMNFYDPVYAPGTVMDIRIGPQRARDDPNETIYYLRTSTPHLHDIILSGPYNDFLTVLLQAGYSFGSRCQQGLRAIRACVVVGSPLIPFDHITSPIDHNPEHTRRVELLRRRNPLLAEKLPCTVWTVEYLGLYPEHSQCADGELVQLKSREIVGSFESKTEAQAVARRKSRELVAELGPSSHQFAEMMYQDTLIDRIYDVTTEVVKWVVVTSKGSGVIHESWVLLVDGNSTVKDGK